MANWDDGSVVVADTPTQDAWDAGSTIVQPATPETQQHAQRQLGGAPEPVDWKQRVVKDQNYYIWHASDSELAPMPADVAGPLREARSKITPEMRKGRELQNATDSLRQYYDQNPEHVQSYRNQKTLESRLPFAGSIVNVADSLKVIESARKFNKGEYTQEDVARLAQFVVASESASKEEQAKPWFKKVQSALGDMIPYALEFAATSGGYTVARTAATGITKKLLGRAAETLAGRIATAAIPRVAGVAAQTALNPGMVAKSTAQQQLSSVLAGNDQSFLEALPAGAVDAMAEIGSERAGGLIGKMAGKLVPTTIKTAIADAWMRYTGKTVQDLAGKLAEKTGWNGLVGELGEERVGEVIRGVFGKLGVGNFDFGTTGQLASGNPEGLKQLGIESAAFSVPGLASGAAQLAGGLAEKRLAQLQAIRDAKPQELKAKAAEVGITGSRSEIRKQIDTEIEQLQQPVPQSSQEPSNAGPVRSDQTEVPRGQEQGGPNLRGNGQVEVPAQPAGEGTGKGPEVQVAPPVQPVTEKLREYNALSNLPEAITRDTPIRRIQKSQSTGKSLDAEDATAFYDHRTGTLHITDEGSPDFQSELQNEAIAAWAWKNLKPAQYSEWRKAAGYPESSDVRGGVGGGMSNVDSFASSVQDWMAGNSSGELGQFFEKLFQAKPSQTPTAPQPEAKSTGITQARLPSQRAAREADRLRGLNDADLQKQLETYQRIPGKFQQHLIEIANDEIASRQKPQEAAPVQETQPAAQPVPTQQETPAKPERAKKSNGRTPKASKEPETLLHAVQQLGGLSGHKLSNGERINIYEDLKQFGLLGAMQGTRPGKRGTKGVHDLEEMARELESGGYWKAPEGANKGDALLAALKQGAKTFHGIDKEVEREYAKHEEELRNAEPQGVAREDIEKTLRSAEEDFASEGGATEGDAAEVIGEVDDSFDFGANAKPADVGMPGEQKALFENKEVPTLFNMNRGPKVKSEKGPSQNELDRIEAERKANYVKSLPGQKTLETAAERAQRESEEGRPDIEGRGFGLGGGKFKGQRVRPDAIPDAMKAPDAQEQRLDAARGYRKPSMIQRVREALSHLKGVFRSQEHIPATEEFGSANEFFRLLKVAPNMAQDEAIRTTAAIVDPLGPKQLKLFERLAVMENLSASVAQGQPLRFGFKSQEDVDAYRDKLRAIASKVPEVQKAIDSRKKIVRETVEKLVEYDLLPKEALDNAETYYHQQVHFYMLAQGTKSGARPGKKKRSFQKSRVLGEELAGEEMDYNTSYIEAESSWMTDALMEIEKERLFRNLMKRYDSKPALMKQAKEQEVSWQSLADQDPSVDIFQPEPGNVFYRAFTIPDRIVEQLEKNVIETAELSKEDLRTVLALGGPKAQYVVPTELADQLRASQKVTPAHGLAAISDGAMRFWKVWTLLNPKRALAYNLRNMTGDIDPVVAADPSLIRHTDRAMKELKGYHDGTLKLSDEMRLARDLGVIGSGFVAEEVPDISELPVFRRFAAEVGQRKSMLNPVRSYFDTVKKYSQFREDLMRYATFLGYLQQLRQGRVKNYGGSNKAVVDALKREMGVEVAAAHLARNLMGDYGNITVAGNWIRRRLMPFWAFQEINLKRVPRLAVNALEAGGTVRTAGALSASAARAILTSRIAWMYAGLWIWNHLIQGGDEEDELTADDRASPHVILGRNPDGSIRVFRNVGALGDFLEWFGINDALSMWSKLKADQVDVKDVVWEMAFATPEKMMGSMRPDLKALYEVPTSTSLYPNPFQPRSVRRGEVVAGTAGLEDEYKWAKGLALRDGSAPRPNYWQRWFIGVVDPRQSALTQTYDLRNEFLKKKGKEEQGTFPISKYKEARDAAMAENYQAFVDWKRKFVEERGKSAYKDFKTWLPRLDPIASRLTDKEEREFEKEFLTNEQRQRFTVARNYAGELRDLLLAWWKADEQSKKPSGD